MLLSHDKQFIFLKTVKTASTSIEQYLQKYCTKTYYDFSNEYEDFSHKESSSGIITPPLFYTNDIGETVRSDYWDHMTATELGFKLSSEIWDNYFKFAVVRNPFDKILSIFYFIIRNDCVGSNIPIQGLFEYHLPNILNESLYADSMIYTINGELILTDIIRYETLQKDFERVCNKLRIDNGVLPKINSQYRPKAIKCKDVYSEYSKRLVSEKFSFEIETFGYTFPKN